MDVATATAPRSTAPPSTTPPSTAPPSTAPPTASLSPSRAQDFQACPLLYRYRVVDRLPEPPSAAAVRGTLVHAVLDALFALPAAERTPEAAIALLQPQWRALLAEEPGLASVLEGDDEEWFGRAGDLLESYFAMEDPRRLEPAARELRVEAELPNGLVLRGFVDRLDRASTGQVRVVDYKTGRPPGAGYEARAMFQMRFYALVLWRMHGQVPTVLQLMYLSTGHVLRYEPDEADLRAMERKLEALWAAIDRAHRSGDWRANRSALCQWCSHRAICPEWGGTPPPLPGRDEASGGAAAEASDETATRS